MIRVGILDSSNNFVDVPKSTVIEVINGVSIMGTLDDNNQFVQPHKHPVAYQANGNITVQGTLNLEGEFVSPTKPIAFQTNGNIILQGTLDNNQFIAPSSHPIAFFKNGNLTIQGFLDSEGIFNHPIKPTAYLSDGDDPTPTPSPFDDALGLWITSNLADNVIPNALSTQSSDSNLITGSRRMFSSTPHMGLWLVGNAVATDCNELAPDGSMEASTIVSDPSSFWIVSQAVPLPANTYTICATVKNIGSDFTQLLIGQPYEQEALRDITDEWSRISYTFTLAADNPGGSVGIRSAGLGSEANFAVCDIELFEGESDLNPDWMQKPIRIQNAELTVGKNKFFNPTLDGEYLVFNNTHSKIQFPSISTPNAITLMFNGSRVNQTRGTWEIVTAQSSVRGTNFDNFAFGQDVVAGPDIRINSTEISTQANDGLIGGSEHTFAITLNDSEQVWYINGVRVYSASRTDGIPEVGDWIVGSRVGDADFSNYQMKSLAVWNRSLNHSDIKAATTELQPVINQRLVILEGDSITHQMRATVGFSLTKPSFGWNHAIINSTIIGETSLESRSIMIDEILMSAPVGTNGILTVLIGANDIAGTDTVESWLAQLESYLTDRKSAGWKIVLGTVLPRGDLPEHNTRRNIANPILRSWAGILCDAIADYAADPALGDDDSYWNTGLWADPVHPNTNGHNIMYPILAAAIDSIE